MAELRGIYQRMVAAVDAGNMEQFHELDLAFHRQIYAMADHELLLQMWTTIEANVERSIFYGNFQHQDEPSQILLDSHRLILEAIESGNIEAAKSEIDRQLNSASDTLVAKWKRYNSTD
jgi:DNA-binding GntR family transcriptional regulator